MKFLSFLKNLFTPSFFVLYFCGLFFTFIGKTPYGKDFIYTIFLHGQGDPAQGDSSVINSVGGLIFVIGAIFPILYFSQVKKMIEKHSLFFNLLISLLGGAVAFIFLIFSQKDYFSWTVFQCVFWTFVPFFLEALLIALIKKMLKKEQECLK